VVFNGHFYVKVFFSVFVFVMSASLVLTSVDDLHGIAQFYLNCTVL